MILFPFLFEQTLINPVTGKDKFSSGIPGQNQTLIQPMNQTQQQPQPAQQQSEMQPKIAQTQKSIQFLRPIAQQIEALEQKMSRYSNIVGPLESARKEIEAMLTKQEQFLKKYGSQQ